LDKLLTLKEVAELLQVNERTALRLAHAGDLPATRVGGQWRVHPVELERWFFAARAENAVVDEQPLLCGKHIVLDLDADSVDDVLDSIARHLADTGELIYPSVFKNALAEREAMMSTGVGEGVAIPHARHSITGLFRHPVCVFVRLAQPIEFHAVDGAPVDLVFGLAAPSNDLHLECLARVMRFARAPAVRERLRAVKDAAEAVAALTTP
jgi:PTS system nitrogen regulatory IIA component